MGLPNFLRALRPASPPAKDEAFELTFDREQVRVAVKRVASSRRFTLRVRATNRDVVLTMPKRASAKEARAFAERHAGWVLARLARLPKTIDFAPGALVPLRGIDHRLAHVEGSRAAADVDLTSAEPRIRAGGDVAFFGRRVEDFLKREARVDLEKSVADYCAKIGAPKAPFTLRDTSSRWGSCTATGRLNFSWRLIMAPDHVLDYLAAHEVAHLRHMNHSPAFWRLLKGMCAATDRAEAWLKANGAQLHRYGGG